MGSWIELLKKSIQNNKKFESCNSFSSKKKQNL